MQKRTFYAELAYVVGLTVLAFSSACMTTAGFGVSMVVAPAYLLHLKLVQLRPFFSFGMAEYCFQALLLLAMILVLRRIRLYYFFSFVTAVLFGFLLDGFLALLGLISCTAFAYRAALYCIGVVSCSMSVAMLFHTYLAPEVYELLVKEVAAKYGRKLSAVKTVYDCSSCLAGIVMSFCFFGFGHFEGIRPGTVLCALVNGWLIGRFSRWYEKRFDFRDRFPLRKYFS